MQPAGISLTQLRAFVAVAEARRFTTAAEAIGITQPAVSYAIRSLEHTLGVALFARGRTEAELSEVGRELLVHAREVLSRIECLRQAANAAQGLESGRVRIGTVPSAAARLLPRLVRQFRNRHPKVEVVLLEGTDQEVRQWVESGIVDAGIAALPLPNLATTAVADDEFLLVVASTHPLAVRPKASLREIRNDAFILSAGGCGPAIRELFARAGVSPKIEHEVRETSAVLSMVREGLGVTIIPTLSLPPGVKGLASLPLVPRAQRTLALAWRPTLTPSPALAAFTALVEVLRGTTGPGHVTRDGPKRSSLKPQAR